MPSTKTERLSALEYRAKYSKIRVEAAAYYQMQDTGVLLALRTVFIS